MPSSPLCTCVCPVYLRLTQRALIISCLPVLPRISLSTRRRFTESCSKTTPVFCTHISFSLFNKNVYVISLDHSSVSLRFSMLSSPLLSITFYINVQRQAFQSLPRMQPFLSRNNKKQCHEVGRNVQTWHGLCRLSHLSHPTIQGYLNQIVDYLAALLVCGHIAFSLCYRLVKTLCI